MLRYTVREEHCRISTDDYLRDFVDVPRFLEFCRACSWYGRNWACPGLDFDPVAVWSSRDWLHLTAFWMEFSDDQPRTGLAPAQLISEVKAMYHHEKRRAHRRLMAMRTASPGSYPVGAGECDLCPTCTRERDHPCRIPDQLVHSIESLGGNVEATMRVLFGHAPEWSDGTSLPDRFALVIGLLCDQAEPPHSPARSGKPTTARPLKSE